MLLEIDKEALISLVIGQQPYYSVFEHSMVKKCGHYKGGNHDEWVWHDCSLEELSEQELYDLYILCRESWNKK